MNIKYLILITIIDILLIGPVTAANHQREQRQINDGWSFRLPSDSISTSVHLPHCWNSDSYHRQDYYRGKGIYTRKLSIPESFKDKKIFLRLDGVATSGEIYVDSIPVGQTTGGYSSHTFDLTPYLIPGQPSTLTVVADNSRHDIPPYSADFTFMGGIYRDVWLLALSDIHLDISDGTPDGFTIRALPAHDGKWIIEAGGVIVNERATKAKAIINMTVTSHQGDTVAKISKQLVLKANTSTPFEIETSRLKAVELWSPESPNLYNVEITVSVNGQTTDRASSYTGFRTYGFDENGAFLLNGQPYKLRGMCRHQDREPMGIALGDEQHRQDMRLIKDMGANFVRISHYPQDDAVLEMCDRLGLIVWEEIPVIDYVPLTDGFDDNCEQMLRDMIRRHRNHPSIAMWGYMNEILLRVPDEGRQQTIERTRRLAERLENMVREEDPDRLTTMAFHGSDVYHEAGLTGITDVKGWNLYQGWYGGKLKDFESYLERQHILHPDHRLIISEYGAGSDRRIHSFDPQPFDFSMEYQQKYLEHYLPVIEDSAYVAGSSHWNLIDFSSANRQESMPHINNKGILTNQREKKDVYYYFSSMWHDSANDTVVHIAIDDWKHRTDIADERGIVEHPVKVYTNLPAIALVVNGQDIGKKIVNNCIAEFSVNFRDGNNTMIATDPSTKKILDATTITCETIPVADGKIALGDRELGINVGSLCYFNSVSTPSAWLPDREYTEGSLYGHIGGRRETTTGEIHLSADDPLLQSCMKDLSGYRFDVEPGEYEVELLFAELSAPLEKSAYLLGYDMGVGDSQWTNMDISINGKPVEKNFSPGSESGDRTMVRRLYRTSAPDARIEVEFDRAKGATHLSAIKIRKL